MTANNIIVMVVLWLMCGMITGCTSLEWTCFTSDLIYTVVTDDPYGPYSSCYSDHWYYHDHDDDHEEETSQTQDTQGDAPEETKRLYMEGSGDSVQLIYGETIFAAVKDPESAQHLFSPDTDGSISGEIISCRAVIDEVQVTGLCLRSGHICTFSYQRDDQTEGEGYPLVATTCVEQEGLGPFQVPPDAPLDTDL